MITSAEPKKYVKGKNFFHLALFSLFITDIKRIIASKLGADQPPSKVANVTV
jgi:hypothetical protein